MLRIVTNHIIFFIALLYIYIFFFYKRCYVSNHPDTQHKMVDWISEGKKKKRKELIQPDPVINRRDLKWLDLGGDLIRLFLFTLIFLYINIQHFIYYICNVKILKSRFEVFRPFGFRVATADRPSPLRKPGLWRGFLIWRRFYTWRSPPFLSALGTGAGASLCDPGGWVECPARGSNPQSYH